MIKVFEIWNRKFLILFFKFLIPSKQCISFLNSSIAFLINIVYHNNLYFPIYSFFGAYLEYQIAKSVVIEKLEHYLTLSTVSAHFANDYVKFKNRKQETEKQN